MLRNVYSELFLQVLPCKSQLRLCPLSLTLESWRTGWFLRPLKLLICSKMFSEPFLQGLSRFAQKSGYGNVRKILKITVKCPFPNQLIIWIYYFEVNMMTHLNFCDPAVKFFLNHQKNSNWNIELDNLVGVGGWVFPGHPLKFSPFC